MKVGDNINDLIEIICLRVGNSRLRFNPGFCQELFQVHRLFYRLVHRETFAPDTAQFSVFLPECKLQDREKPVRIDKEKGNDLF